MNKIITVMVNGAFGKMGALASETLMAHTDFDVVGRLGRSDDLRQAIRAVKPDVVLDLTVASVVEKNLAIILEEHAHPVIGTSGLTHAAWLTYKTYCDAHHWGGIIVPNFSMGAVLMMHCAALIGRYFPDVEIIEGHHPNKQDAPSGTALKTAEKIAASRQKSSCLTSSSSLARGMLCHDIPIHAMRLPGLVAQQDVIFGNVGETLQLTHRTMDRASFMPGVILACQAAPTLLTLHDGLASLLPEFKVANTLNFNG